MCADGTSVLNIGQDIRTKKTTTESTRLIEQYILIINNLPVRSRNPRIRP
jgi:hypothetical protein